jgi:hypothetical protein
MTEDFGIFTFPSVTVQMKPLEQKNMKTSIDLETCNDKISLISLITYLENITFDEKCCLVPARFS